MRAATLVFLVLIFSSAAYAAKGSAGSEAAGSDSVPVRTLSVPLAVPLGTYADSIVSGGPKRDGIPSIDAPRFIAAQEADGYLKPDDVVFGVVVNGEARAYPQRILVWHEIINDSVGGEAVAVTYCPLTGTAIGFERGATTFGVSGRLVNNNLIMYDRSTQSLWPQLLATAVEGPLKGRSLVEFPVVWTRWARWRERYPATRVLSTDTGFARNYFSDPYGNYNPVRGYYERFAPPLFPVLHADDRLAPKEVVIGARSASGAVAFRKDTVRDHRVMDGELDGGPVVVAYDADLDAAYVYLNPQRQRFSYGEDGVQGRDGAWPAGELPLERLNTIEAMWFAWYAFFPDTRVYE